MALISFGFSETPEIILRKMVEKDLAIHKELQSWEYSQLVKNWSEPKPGQMHEVEEIQMKVRPKDESSFKILTPKGEWIHGGTPDNSLTKQGRDIQRNLAVVSLNTLLERFDFTGIGEEKRGGIRAYRFHLKPKTSFKPKTRIEKVMKEVEGDLWVGLDDYSVIEVEAGLAKPVPVAWMLATVHEMKFNYKSIPLPMGRTMTGFDLVLKLDGITGKLTRYRQVQMTDFKNNPGQDIW